jgi:hypothetical protein
MNAAFLIKRGGTATALCSNAAIRDGSLSEHHNAHRVDD